MNLKRLLAILAIGTVTVALAGWAIAGNGPGGGRGMGGGQSGWNCPYGDDGPGMGGGMGPGMGRMGGRGLGFGMMQPGPDDDMRPGRGAAVATLLVSLNLRDDQKKDIASIIEDFLKTADKSGTQPQAENNTPPMPMMGMRGPSFDPETQKLADQSVEKIKKVLSKDQLEKIAKFLPPAFQGNPDGFNPGYRMLDNLRAMPDAVYSIKAYFMAARHAEMLADADPKADPEKLVKQLRADMDKVRKMSEKEYAAAKDDLIKKFFPENFTPAGQTVEGKIGRLILNPFTLQILKGF